MVIENESHQVEEWEELMFLYRSALRKMETKIGILNDEFQSFYNTNPIEHVKSRIKSPKSISEKLRKLGCDVTIENMELYLSDIAGIRVICSFMSDVMVIAEKIKEQEDVTVVLVKDYMNNPKPNGYKSYHMVVTIPVYNGGRNIPVKVEIQIRTIAMDFGRASSIRLIINMRAKCRKTLKMNLNSVPIWFICWTIVCRI